MSMTTRSRPVFPLSRLPLLAALVFSFQAHANPEESQAEPVPASEAEATSFSVKQTLTDAFRESGQVWKRDAIAYARLPKRSEMGQILMTFELDERGKPAMASESEIVEDTVIVREMTPLIGAVYREYLMTKSDWYDVYGLQPDTLSFHSYSSRQTIRVLPVDESLLLNLGSPDGQPIAISTAAFPQHHTVQPDQSILLKRGDWISEQGVVYTREALDKDYNPQDLPTAAQ
ncbi:hypothetical protein KDD30_17410 (plasmid) [Photobacterium sp. GJ3]|uniref:hypothetical protein n=1 Tax=Photobacterium sp. GJ3 TaxID=2829502 RepID=UPI001B8C74B4|nr:hypothetical protein [Photobacterium sp. GJ3]QUJ69942.1 hypothetical protein KDD30_17410 [Photobacterium sp. GJ3]